MDSTSEVATLRQRIEEEYAAAQRALYAPAMTAKHEFINQRMENMQRAHEQLRAMVGEQEAARLFVTTLEGAQDAGTNEPVSR